MTFNPVPKPNFRRRKPKKKKRGAFDKEARQQIIDRDKGLCRCCGKQGSEIHHVKFKSSSGRGVFTNGMLVCQSCHIEIHQDFNLATFWRNKFKELYGDNYYKDDWD